MTLSPQGTAFDAFGPSDAPALVLIHGLGLTRSSTWTGMIPKLAEDHRVIAYDLAGHGESALPTKQPSLTLLAEQLRDLLDYLRIQSAALVGFSLGGMINRRFAMDNPGRAAAVVILNSPHERSPEQQKLVEKRAADTSAGGPDATIHATLERWFTAEFRHDNAKVVEQVKSVVLANNPKNYALHRQVLAKGVIELIRPEPPLRLPALVMTCEKDTGSTPTMSRAIAAEIEGAKLSILPDLQHLGLIERPDLFQDVIVDFLRTSAINGMTK